MLRVKQLTEEQLQEMSMIEIAHQILAEKKQPIAFHEILKEVASLLGMSEDEAQEKMAQFYTDLNIDGRFFAAGDNKWGLRAWYPVDQQEEEVIAPKKKKKKAKKAVEDDFEVIEEDDIELDEEEELDEDGDEDFDDFDEDEFEDEEELEEDLLEDDFDELDDFDDEDEE